MLLDFFNFLAKEQSFFNVFSYISIRAVLAIITALIISFILGPWFIKKLGDYSFGQYVRKDGIESHIIKTGTPTMGGGLILISILISTLLWADLNNRYIWLLIIVTVSFAVIGLIDDYSQIKNKKSDGLSALQKYGLQSLVGFSAAIYILVTAST